MVQDTPCCHVRTCWRWSADKRCPSAVPVWLKDGKCAFHHFFMTDALLLPGRCHVQNCLGGAGTPEHLVNGICVAGACYVASCHQLHRMDANLCAACVSHSPLCYSPPCVESPAMRFKLVKVSCRVNNSRGLNLVFSSQLPPASCHHMLLYVVGQDSNVHCAQSQQNAPISLCIGEFCSTELSF